MDKQKKIRTWISVGIVIILAIIGIVLALFIVNKNKAVANVDAAIEDYDEEYTTILPAKADSFMNIDGVLDEKEWSGKQVFKNRFSDDFTMKSPNLEMITHLTEKGLYVGVTVYDSNVTYTGVSAPLRNSTLVLNIAPSEKAGKADVHRVYMNVEKVLSTTNANVYSCAYGVKVDGEVNSGKTENMTMELFLPWKSIGMETPENLDVAEVLLNPYYNAMFPGESTARQLKAFPNSDTNAVTFWRFAQVGYVDADKEDALIGDSKYGVAKRGAWDVSTIQTNTNKSNEYTLTYSGRAKTEWGLYNRAYLTKASATDFVFEATVVPLSSNDSTGDGAYAGIAAELPGGKQLSMRMFISKSNFGVNESGKTNQNKIRVTRVYQDFYNGIYDSYQICDYENTNFDSQEGVKLKMVKSGSNYYLYVDDALMWSGSESRGVGLTMPSLYSSNCKVEYKDIKWTTYDNRQEELRKTFTSWGTCLIETQVEGAGEITSDVIAVTKGGEATITVSAMPEYILSDVLVNGKSVMADFKKNAFFEGILNKYTIKNIQAHTTITAVYEKYEGVSVSGKVSIKGEKSSNDIAETKIIAYLADHRLLVFSSAVGTDGNYTISLPKGTYSKLYFAHTRYEQIYYKFSDGKALKVGSTPLKNKNFTLTYPTFESFVKGAALETGNWYIVDNGKYTAVGNNGGNDYSTAYFRDSASDNFVVKATVTAEAGAQIGAFMYGEYNKNSGYQMMVDFVSEGSYATSLFGWHATARPVNWIGTSYGDFRGNSTVYPENKQYNIVIAKWDDSVVLYVNGVYVREWNGKVANSDGDTFDLSKFDVSKVGLSIRGTIGATFSNYSYSSSMTDVKNVFCRKVTFSNLPANVTVNTGGKKITSGTLVRRGEEVTVKFPVESGYVYAVTVNGKPIPVSATGGKATFTVEEASVIAVTKKKAYSVSGNVAGKPNGSVTATEINSGESYLYENVLKNGSYSISIPDGTYKLYFDCGKTEGLLTGVTVSGKALTNQNLDKTYIKVTEYKDFHDLKGSAEWVLTENGRYEIQTSNQGSNNISMGYFADGVNLKKTDFVIKTNVETSKNTSVMIGLVVSGKIDGKQRTVITGLINDNNDATNYCITNGFWGGYKGGAVTYNRRNFELTIVKRGNTVTFLTDGTQFASWDISKIVGDNGTLDISGMTDAKVGIGIYRTFDVTFSEYSYSTNKADIDKVLNRIITFQGLPAGITVSADGKTISSGASIPFGTEITVNCPTNTNKAYIVTVNGQGLIVNKGKAKFKLTEDAKIIVSAENTYKVSGTVSGKVNGTVTATEVTDGYGFVFEGALKNGSYSIDVPNGTYKIHFDCGKTEGLLTDVTVSGKALTNQNLGKTYIKPGIQTKSTSSTGSVEWVLTDNGRYEVQTTNNSCDTISMGYFDTVAKLNNTDFVIETTVEAGGDTSVMIGLALSGTLNGKAENVLVGLINNTNAGTIRLLNSNGWHEYTSIASYDRTNYDLTIIKKNNTIYFFIDETLYAQWSTKTAGYDFSSMTNVKVGVGIYRLFDVAFSEYSYSSAASDVTAALSRMVTFGELPSGVTITADGKSVNSGDYVLYGANVTVNCPTNSEQVYAVTVNGQAITVEDGKASIELTEDVKIEVTAKRAYKVSGTITGQTSGSITATETTTGEAYTYKNVLTPEGTYEVNIPNGTYNLYFDCADTEGLIPSVTVSGDAVTGQNLTKTYPKLAKEMYGDLTHTAEWVLVDNGCYEVQSSDTGGNTISAGYFDTVSKLSETDFVINTNVKAAGKTSVMIGLVVNGTVDGSKKTVITGLINNNNDATNYCISNGFWGGYTGSATTYDKTNFKLTIVKSGNTVTFFTNGLKYASWDISNIKGDSGTLNISGMTDAKIGIGIYRMQDVTFSDYSYSTDAVDVNKALNRKVTFEELPTGVTITADGKSLNSGDYVAYGTEVTVNCPSDSNMIYAVTVNGKGDLLEDGKVKLELTEDVKIEVTAKRAYKVSGTITGQTSGSITATETTTGEAYTYKNVLTADGTYEINIPNGTYKLYFDCGDTEGLIPSVTVSDANVTEQNLVKTYQKLTSMQYNGYTGDNFWTLTDNGCYEVQTPDIGGNVMSLGYFDTVDSFGSTDFVINTDVKAAGNTNVVIGLVVQGNLNNAGKGLIFGIENQTNNGARCYEIIGGKWANYTAPSVSYDKTDFEMTMVKSGDIVTIYIDGNKFWSWDITNLAGVDYSGMTDARIALGIYRLRDVTFSDYSYSTDAVDVNNALNRTVTFGELPTGVTITADGKSLNSGDYVAYGTEVTVNCSSDSDMIYAVTVNGKAATLEDGKVKFELTENTRIVVTAKRIYKVSGTITGQTSGSITATETTTGEAYSFKNVLTANGTYEISIPNGTYKLYFDCGDTEGLIPSVTVSDANVAGQNLAKIYQKLTAMQYNGYTSDNFWSLTDNGCYKVQTPDVGGNVMSLGYFDTVDSFGSTDFVINTNVKAAGNTSVVIGLVVQGNLNNAGKGLIFGIENQTNNGARCYEIIGSKWANYTASSISYDKTDFEMTMVKSGDVVTVYIDGNKFGSWDITNLAGVDYRGMTNAKIGLGIYRLQDVTFSDYSYSTDAADVAEALTSAVSGTIKGVTSGTIKATSIDGRTYTFENALASDGTYKISLPNGTYKLYFDCGNTEGLIPSVTVSGSDVTGQNLAKAYQKLTFAQYNDLSVVANQGLVDNGCYTINNEYAGKNTISAGFFDTVDSFGSMNFVIKTKVKAKGENNVIIGLITTGIIDGKEKRLVLGLYNKDNKARAYEIQDWFWGAELTGETTYDHTEFELTIVKNGNTVTCYVDGNKYASWDIANLTLNGTSRNFSGMTNAKIGIGIYRLDNVTFSDYSYSTNADDINNALNPISAVAYQIREAMEDVLQRRFLSLW